VIAQLSGPFVRSSLDYKAANIILFKLNHPVVAVIAWHNDIFHIGMLFSIFHMDSFHILFPYDNAVPECEADLQLSPQQLYQMFDGKHTIRPHFATCPVAHTRTLASGSVLSLS